MESIVKYHSHLYKLAFEICNDTHTAEDVVQDTFVDALERDICNQEELFKLCKSNARKAKSNSIYGREIPLTAFQKNDDSEYIQELILSKSATTQSDTTAIEKNGIDRKSFRLARSTNSYIKDFLPFEVAREFIRSLGLSNQREWIKWCKTERPPNIPSNPQFVYKNKGWKNVKDWLGSEFLTLEEAIAFIKSNFGPITKREFIELNKKDKIPRTIPKNALLYYKKFGLIYLSDLLDPEHKLKRKEIKFATYEQAKIIVQEKLIPMGINNLNKYMRRSNRHLIPEELPLDLWDYFTRRNEWISSADFFGNEDNKWRGVKKDFMSLKDAQMWCRMNLRPNGINTARKYQAFLSGKINIPVENPGTLHWNPHECYEKWPGWGDYLGTGNQGKRKYWPYKRAQFWIRKNVVVFGVTDVSKWRAYCAGKFKAEGLLPLDNRIPLYPDQTYKDKGWVDWYDWFSKEKISFLPYRKARTWIHKNLKSFHFIHQDWELYKKGIHPLQPILPVLPKNIPKDPANTYKGKGWKDFPDFLGTCFTGFLPFDEARQWYLDNLSDTIKNVPQWEAYLRGKYPSLPWLPAFIPKTPWTTYQADYKSANDWFLN